MMYNAHTDPDVQIRSEDRAYRKQVVAANDAFAQLLLKQIKRGKEKATLGTIVDTSACTTHRLRGEPIFSGCSSPAALCAEKGATDAKDVTSYV